MFLDKALGEQGCCQNATPFLDFPSSLERHIITSVNSHKGPFNSCHKLYSKKYGCNITSPEPRGVDISIIFPFYKEMETPQFTELVIRLRSGETGIQNEVLVEERFGWKNFRLNCPWTINKMSLELTGESQEGDQHTQARGPQAYFHQKPVVSSLCLPSELSSAPHVH